MKSTGKRRLAEANRLRGVRFCKHRSYCHRCKEMTKHIVGRGGPECGSCFARGKI